MAEKKKDLLTSWEIVWFGDSAHIRGTIWRDSKNRFRDGDSIVTSPLRLIDFERKIATTKNSTYALE